MTSDFLKTLAGESTGRTERYRVTDAPKANRLKVQMGLGKLCRGALDQLRGMGSRRQQLAAGGAGALALALAVTLSSTDAETSVPSVDSSLSAKDKAAVGAFVPGGLECETPVMSIGFNADADVLMKYAFAGRKPVNILQYRDLGNTSAAPRVPSVHESSVVDVYGCATAEAMQSAVSINGAHDTITLDQGAIAASPRFRLSEAGLPGVVDFSPDLGHWHSLALPQSSQLDALSVGKVNASLADFASKDSRLTPIAVNATRWQALVAFEKNKTNNQLEATMRKVLARQALSELRAQAAAQGVDIKNTKFVVSGKSPQGLAKDFSSKTPNRQFPKQIPVQVKLKRAEFRQLPTGVGK